MSEVKTYAVNCNDAWLNTAGDDISGSYVKYADYMALATKLDLAERACAELAAENVGLKTICDDRRRFIMNGVQMGYIKVPAAETDPDLETIRIAISPQKPIPATDDFLAEIERKAIRKFINSIEHILRDKLSPYDTEEMLEAMRIFLEEQGAKR